MVRVDTELVVAVTMGTASMVTMMDVATVVGETVCGGAAVRVKR